MDARAEDERVDCVLLDNSSCIVLITCIHALMHERHFRLPYLPRHSKIYFSKLLDEFRAIEQRFKACEKRIVTLNKDNDVYERLDGILGIGPIIASATYAAAGDGKDFENCRYFFSWLGLVPG